jgi:hypothetical protein
MPGAKKNFIGLEGFIWWVGVVEDRNDPEQLGRVRVRCFGWHTDDKTKIPTDSLPWAHPVIPINSPNMHTPKEGDMVFGFFIDGDNAQNPAIMGVFPGKPEKKPNYENGFSDPAKDLSGRPKKPDDSSEAYPKNKYLKEATTNRLSRGKSESTVIATRTKNLKKSIVSAGGVTWSEPSPAFKPKYPYNNALETESGHALEFDDSPGQERVHLAHRKGSFIEIDKDGNRVEKVVKDNYELVMGSDYVYISGKCSVTVGGDCNLKVGGNMNIEVAGGINMAAGGDIRMKGKKVMIESSSDFDAKIGGAGKITSKNKLNLKGATAALQGATIDLPAAQINMQSGSAESASGTGLTGGGSAPSADEANTAATETANTAANTDKTAATTSANVVTSTTVTTGSSVGKDIAGGTSTVSNVFSGLSAAADGVIQNLASNLPIGELTNKVQNFESDVNSNRGSILSLKTDLKNTLFAKIDAVALGASAKNIPFTVDSEIQSAITKVVNPVAQYTTQLGKHIYAKTESVLIPSANSA